MALDGGVVQLSAWRYVPGPGGLESDMEDRCSHPSTSFSGCQPVRGGWVTWVDGPLDSAETAAGAVQVRVTYFRHDGVVVDVTAVHVIAGSSPLRSQPAVSRKRLIDIALGALRS
jgi:hypothetical protein